MNLKRLAAKVGRLLLPSTMRLRRLQSRVVREELKVKTGFHGDQHLLLLADFFLRDADTFVETGTLAGSTAHYVGRRYSLKVFSCESDVGSWEVAKTRCEECSNIEIVNEQSPDFLYRLFDREPSLANASVVFWLDAHGYGFQWPLLQEIEFITRRLDSAVIMIDDFKVPGRPEFGFDAYDGQECSIDYIAPALNPDHQYTLILPTYSQRTSPYHGLRGVGTIVYGAPMTELPRTVAAQFSTGLVDARGAGAQRSGPV